MKQASVKLILLRVVLGFLILCNMGMIFYLSAQSSKKSGETSHKIGTAISESLGDKKFEDKTLEERRFFRDVILFRMRKFAHAAEFGSLATLIYCFLLTWDGRRWLQYLISLGATLLYAISDEVHQHFSDGRSMALMDVGIDMSGALFCASVVLLIVYIIKRRKKARENDSLPSSCTEA